MYIGHIISLCHLAIWFYRNYFSFRPIYLPRTIVNVLVFDVKKRVLFRGHGKMLSSYKHPVRLATQLSALAVHRRWLGKLRRSGTEDFRSGNMEWRHTDTTDKEYSWMNEWFVSSVNMSCHLPPKQRSSSQHYPLSGFLCSMSLFSFRER